MLQVTHVGAIYCAAETSIPQILSSFSLFQQPIRGFSRLCSSVFSLFFLLRVCNFLSILPERAAVVGCPISFTFYFFFLFSISSSYFSCYFFLFLISFFFCSLFLSLLFLIFMYCSFSSQLASFIFFHAFFSPLHFHFHFVTQVFKICSKITNYIYLYQTNFIFVPSKQIFCCMTIQLILCIKLNFSYFFTDGKNFNFSRKIFILNEYTFVRTKHIFNFYSSVAQYTL